LTGAVHAFHRSVRRHLRVVDQRIRAMCRSARHSDGAVL